MGESAGAPAADVPSPEGQDAPPPTLPLPSDDNAHGRAVIHVVPQGDIVLDVTFKTSQETIRKSRKLALAAARKAGASAAPPPDYKPTTKFAYRVSLGALKSHSKYFTNLLTNTQFGEARVVADGHASLKERGIVLADARSEDLPWVAITDDDEATRAAGRDHIFEDMLRIVHQLPPKVTRVNMAYVATLAVTADRFDTAAAVSRCLNIDLKYKWPVTSNRPLQDDSGRPTDVEQTLRQKILVAWLLNWPMRLHSSSKELVLRGSVLWGASHDSDAGITAAWWSLPDGLEHELQYRRDCIMHTIASVQRHFLGKYSSRDRQCQLGYDSSGACDSFQFGQMVKFFLSKELVSFVDFSPSSLDFLPDTSMLDINTLLTTLHQCPGYQVDRNHTNCGLRTRLDPILSYIRAMLSSNAVAIPLASWRANRRDVSWVVSTAGGRLAGAQEDVNTFSFTRALANDQRLRLEGAMYADRLAKDLFTAEAWDWTPET